MEKVENLQDLIQKTDSERVENLQVLKKIQETSSEERVRWLAKGLSYLLPDEKVNLKRHLTSGVRVLSGPDAVTKLNAIGGA